MPTQKLDRERANRLLAMGRTVRQVAVELDVSTQAIYRALKAGQIVKPEPATPASATAA
jgi:hypothetical protein